MHIDAQRQRRIGNQHRHPPPVGHKPLAHPRPVLHQVALAELSIARGHHPPDAAAQQRRIQRLVGVQPGPHIGIHRQDQPLHQDLSLAHLGQRRLDHGEVLPHRFALGAAHEVDLAGSGHGWLLLAA